MKKRRTRQHIIADLGFNYVERQVLKAGYVLEDMTFDYGYDGLIITFDENGEVATDEIFIQLKSTDHIRYSKRHDAYTFDLSVRDLELWLYHSKPVILLLYDAVEEAAYYLDMQRYFRENGISLRNVHKFVRVYVPANNLLTPEIVVKLNKDNHAPSS